MKNYSWLNADSKKFLKRGYLEEGETPEERIETIAKPAESYLKIKGYAEKFTDYMSKGFYSLSSPIWSNFGKERGLPISCFGSFIPDDMEKILTPTRIYSEIPEIIDKYKENLLGICHITGGGIIENLPRILPDELTFELNDYEFPDIFKWIQNKSIDGVIYEKTSKLLNSNK